METKLLFLFYIDGLIKAALRVQVIGQQYYTLGLGWDYSNWRKYFKSPWKAYPARDTLTMRAAAIPLFILIAL
jgi:hypothetical protein